MSAPLSRAFFRRGPVELARDLLGRHLVRRFDDGATLVGRIVEAEAYLGGPDRAAHSHELRRTARNESMYLDAGHAYAYFTYGMHWCFNIVADRAGVPTACLLRALEPVEGAEVMRANRAGRIPAARLRETDLCSGPAKLTQAMRIDRTLDGLDLTDGGPLHLLPGRPVPEDRIVAGPRIGVGYAGEWAARPLRFYEKENPHVSR